MAEDRVRERGIGASGSVRAQAADRASQFLSFLRMPVVAQIAEDRVRERRFGARSYLSVQAADHTRQGPSFLRTPMLPRIPEDRVCERGLGERGSVSVHGAYRASQFPNLVCDCRPKIGTQRVTLVREELAKVPLSTCRPQAWEGVGGPHGPGSLCAPAPPFSRASLPAPDGPPRPKPLDLPES